MINFQELEKVAEFKNGELNWLEGRDINAVYVILVGDEYYIGSSHYTYLRIGQHMDKLLKGEHHSCKLQEKFDSTNEFEVFVLERGIERKKLLVRENYYISKYKPSLNIMLAETTPCNKRMKVRIREIMSEKGITSVELAEKIGVSKATISNLINNKTMPSIDTLGKIATALGVPDWQLFASKEEAANDVKEDSLLCPYCGREINIELTKKGND